MRNHDVQTLQSQTLLEVDLENDLHMAIGNVHPLSLCQPLCAPGENRFKICSKTTSFKTFNYKCT